MVEPLYTVAEAYDCLKQFAPVAYNAEIQLSPGVRALFRDAGHILGSSMLEIWVTEGAKATKLVVSGDLGQSDQPIIKDPVFIDEADYVIIESTYGNRRHESYDREERLGEIVKASILRGGNVVIPAFAVGRTQAILYHLHNLMKKEVIPDIPVFIDSPLAIAATNIFQTNPQEFDSEAYDMLFNENDHPLKLPQLTFNLTPDESRAINNLSQPGGIISASGMADAGRILHHLKHNLWRPECTVLLVGYQAQGSLGRRLLDGVKRVKILGEEIKVKAQIYNLDGFSAHADQQQLLAWLSHFRPAPANVFIVHGEYDAASSFAKLIEERLGFVTTIPGYGDAALIDGREWRLKAADFATSDPALSRLHDFFTQMEALYTAYRLRLERCVAADGAKLPEIIRRLDKISAFVKKTLNDL